MPTRIILETPDSILTATPDAAVSDDEASSGGTSSRTASLPDPTADPQRTFLRQLRAMGYPRATLAALVAEGPPLTHQDEVFEFLEHFDPSPAPAPAAAPDARRWLPPPAPATPLQKLALLVEMYGDASCMYPAGVNMPIVPSPSLPVSSTLGPGSPSFAPDGTSAEELPTCGVCFEPFRVRGLILCCDHLFCNPCIQRWARSKPTCPHCARTFTEVFRSPVPLGPLSPAQAEFLAALHEMGYPEEDLRALQDSGPNLDLHDLVIRWLGEHRLNAEQKALRDTAGKERSQTSGSPAAAASPSAAAAAGGRSPRFRTALFEAELRRLLDMEPGTQEYHTALNQMVDWLSSKPFPAKDALKVLKGPLKAAGPHQLRALAVLDALVHHKTVAFALEVATRKWTERLLQIAKSSRDPEVSARVAALLPDWQRRFAPDRRFREFGIVAAKLPLLAL